jgi:hypothetical protein
VIDDNKTRRQDGSLRPVRATTHIATRGPFNPQQNHKRSRTGFSLEPLRLLHLGHSRRSDGPYAGVEPRHEMLCFSFSSRPRPASRGAPPHSSVALPPRDKQLQRMNKQLMPIKCSSYLYPQSSLLPCLGALLSSGSGRPCRGLQRGCRGTCSGSR